MIITLKTHLSHITIEDDILENILTTDGSLKKSQRHYTITIS